MANKTLDITEENCKQLSDQIEKTRKLYDLCLEYRRTRHALDNPDQSIDHRIGYANYSASEIKELREIELRSLARRIAEISVSIGYRFDMTSKLFEPENE